jgi:hypothetical protein
MTEAAERLQHRTAENVATWYQQEDVEMVAEPRRR